MKVHTIIRAHTGLRSIAALLLAFLMCAAVVLGWPMPARAAGDTHVRVYALDDVLGTQEITISGGSPSRVWYGPVDKGDMLDLLGYDGAVTTVTYPGGIGTQTIKYDPTDAEYRLTLTTLTSADTITHIAVSDEETNLSNATFLYQNPAVKGTGLTGPSFLAPTSGFIHLLNGSTIIATWPYSISGTLTMQAEKLGGITATIYFGCASESFPSYETDYTALSTYISVDLDDYVDNFARDAFIPLWRQAQNMATHQTATSAGAVTTLAGSLSTAFAALTETINYTALQTEVNKYTSYDPNNYEDNTARTTFNTTLAAAREMVQDKDAATQAEVNTLISSLQTQFAALTAVLNYTTLQTRYDVIKAAYVQANYKANAYRTTFEATLALADAMLMAKNAAAQTAIDALLAKLNTDYANLTPATGADLTALTALMTNYTSYKSANYVNNSVSKRADFDTAYNRALAVIAAGAASADQAEVNDLVSKLPTLYATLINVSNLKTLLDEYANFNKDLFSSNAARDAFVAELESARDLYSKNAATTQSQVDALILSLKAKYNAMTSIAANTYLYRELTDSKTGITVSGSKIRADAVLTVTKDSGLHRSGTCDACDEIRDIASRYILLLADIELTLPSSSNEPFQGNITIEFPVSTSYNGDRLSVLHCRNGKLEELKGTVTRGVLSVTVDMLSPFAVLDREYADLGGSSGGLDDDDDDYGGGSVGLPSTGDTKPAWGAVLVIVLLAGFTIFWRKHTR